MAKKFQTYEEALTAQGEAKKAVKEAKLALTDYYNKNKLKRNEDYTDDAKHGGKILRLQQNIDKVSETLADINEQVKELNPSTGKSGRGTKYDYPEDCVTPQQRKKYRIKLRKEAGVDKPKTEEPKKTEKTKTEEPKAEEPKKVVKTKKVVKKTEEEPTKEKPVKKVGKVLSKKAKDKTADEDKTPVKKIKKNVRKFSDD